MKDCKRISDVRDEYLAINRRIEHNTRELTRRAVRYLINALGDRPIAEVTFEDAERFQAWLVDHGLGAVSVNIFMKTISPLFQWSSRRKWILGNPFKDVPMFKVPKQRIRIFERDEFEALLQACPTPVWRVRVLLAKTAGLRRAEVLNLTLDDVDFEKNIIYVQNKKDTLTTWRWTVKDKDRRELPLVDEVANLLSQILLDLPAGQPYLTLTPPRYRRLIQLKNSDAMWERLRVCPDENFTKPFSRILKFAGLKKGTFHDLRRTCITEWLESGLQPHEVMVLAGHSNIDTTMTYYAATRRDLLDKARRASEQNLSNKNQTVNTV